ncbi:MAG: DUF1292 domain-containing protein [Clostridia bacterium]
MNEEKDLDFEETEELEEMITITLEDDSELDCHVLLTYDLDGKDYIALLPVDSEDVYLYSYVELEDGELELSNIEDQEEFTKAADEFHELLGVDEDHDHDHDSDCDCEDEDCDCDDEDCDCEEHK